MEGLSRRSGPLVQRAFVASRLAEDLLSSVYERLLGRGRRRELVMERGRSGTADDGGEENAGQELLEMLATGGRS